MELSGGGSLETFGLRNTPKPLNLRVFGKPDREVFQLHDRREDILCAGPGPINKCRYPVHLCGWLPKLWSLFGSLL